MRCLNNIPHALSQQIYNKAFSLFSVILESGKFQTLNAREKRECSRANRGLFLFALRVLPEPQNQINEVHDFFMSRSDLQKRRKKNQKRT